jgi:SAM-dependent methyltransferase
MSDYSPQRTAQRRQVFEDSAETYHRMRPPYPAALFDDLARIAGLHRGSVVVEVGSGTGLATEHLVARGYSVRCVEPGEKMAAVARANLGEAFEHVESRFEDFEAPAGSVDLVLAATSWMWVDPEIGFEKAAVMLGRDGWFAHAWQTLVDLGPDGFEERLAEIYHEEAPELARTFDSQRSVADGWAEKIAACGLFAPPQVLEYRYQRSFNGWDFVGSASTYGMHAGLEPERRRRLGERIAQLVDVDYGGSVTRFERSLLIAAPTIQV